MIQLECEICKHREWAHLVDSCALCKETWQETSMVFHVFKANNLKYLEECAEKKGLINA